LAYDLARRGVRVRIVERAPEFATSSRGKGLTEKTLEVLEDLGIVSQVLASGRTHFPFRKYRGATVVSEIDPWAQCKPTPDAPYESGVFIDQCQVEAMLRARLSELGVTVELGTELQTFMQHEDLVEATLARHGETIRVDAAYVVGCDGGRSNIRKQLGVRFEGATDETQRLVLGDVQVDGLSRDAWHQWFTPVGMIMLCPLPGTNKWQVQATPDPADPEPTLEGFQRTFDRVAAVPGVRIHSPTWLSTYAVNVRMVDRMRVGRVLLAGDAAHVHPISGALGTNTGIQDAYNLGWKLGMVVGKQADTSLLDTYGEERLPIAAWLLNITSAAHANVTDAIKRPGGGTDAGITTDTSQLRLAYRWSSLAVANEGRLRGGDRAPDAPVRHPETGTPVRLFEVFAGPHFTALSFGDAPAIQHDGVRSWRVVDPEGHARRAYDVTGDAIVLVRPDNYVALVTRDLRDVDAYLTRLRGAPAHP
jgi:2-polyprenyl-6-methoxyphenol hydroxylase-like FAD-dependent oxidoreductase